MKEEKEQKEESNTGLALRFLLGAAGVGYMVYIFVS